MFAFYQQAAVCFVHLADVSDTDDGASTEAWGFASWFRRVWTLQEMLAPSKGHFFDSRWQFFGDKPEMASDISAVCGNPV